jgi:hypothetical protein
LTQGNSKKALLCECDGVESVFGEGFSDGGEGTWHGFDETQHGVSERREGLGRMPDRTRLASSPRATSRRQ